APPHLLVGPAGDDRTSLVRPFLVSSSCSLDSLHVAATAAVLQWARKCSVVQVASISAGQAAPYLWGSLSLATWQCSNNNSNSRVAPLRPPLTRPSLAASARCISTIQSETGRGTMILTLACLKQSGTAPLVGVAASRLGLPQLTVCCLQGPR